MGTAPSLEVQGVRKSFGHGRTRLEVLAGVTFSAPAGRFVSLVGPSGCGKSTLLEVVAGLTGAGEGHVSLDDRAVTTAGAAGYMPQRDHLLPWRNLLKNVLLGPEVRGENLDRAAQRARELLRRFGLAGFETSYPAALSGGMRQRAALLRTVMYEPHFLILDEPLSALDALTRLELQGWLARLVADLGSTVLLVTHDIREALLLSDTVYVLSERPARVVMQLDLATPRPRTPADLATPKMVGLEQRLMDALLVSA